ncbi:MAG TPA: hypothetical protein P5014_02045, partial [Patescibacteria group bacterium]|nr:hypothetical protein [Patescibacteria group bacterium]
MKFSDFSIYMQRLEDTSKRLEMTDILTELIKKLSVDEIDKAIYLASGYVEAPFEEIKFNIAEKMMLKVIEQTFSTPQKRISAEEIQDVYRKTGDLGNVIFEFKKNDKKFSDFSISEVHSKLLEIALIEGTGSQDSKITKISTLLKETDPLSA